MTMGIEVKIGLVTKREIRPDGIRHGREKTQGGCPTACTRVARELPPRSEDLLRYETLKATVQEFMRDDALGLAAQLAFYLILAIFPFILFCVAILDAFSS